MLNHFWLKIPTLSGVTRPKPITEHDPNVFHPAAVCRGPIPEALDLGLVDGVSLQLTFDPAAFGVAEASRFCGEAVTRYLAKEIA